MRLSFALFFLLFCSYWVKGQQSQNVTLLGNWSDTANIRKNLDGQRYNDVWGFVANGREYAAIGSTEGVHIIDVATVQQKCFYPGKLRGVQVKHRDYKVYKHFLYAVCSEGTTMQIFDLNYLPDSLHLVYESAPTTFSGANKIFIDTAKGRLYAATAKTMSTVDQMAVYDLSNPIQPVLKFQYNNPYNNNALVHDMFVRNDTAYCSSSTYGLEVVDFSNPAGYQKIGELTNYQYQGYNHSNWINEKGYGVMTDETYGMPVKVIDVRDVSNMEVVSTFSPRPGDNTCIPHIPYLVGDYAFIAYYFDGLQIYNIADPKNPVRVGYYDTYPDPAYQGFGGAWGAYPFLPSGKILVSDMQKGLFVLDARDAVGVNDVKVPEKIAFTVTPNPASSYLNIDFPKENMGAELELYIYNMEGRMMLGQTIPSASVTNQAIRLTLPANWPGGIYTIRIVTNGRSYFSKFTKI